MCVEAAPVKATGLEVAELVSVATREVVSVTVCDVVDAVTSLVLATDRFVEEEVGSIVCMVNRNVG